MNVVCLIIALSALALVITGLVKENVAMTVTGQLLGGRSSGPNTFSAQFA